MKPVIGLTLSLSEMFEIHLLREGAVEKHFEMTGKKTENEFAGMKRPAAAAQLPESLPQRRLVHQMLE